MTGEGALGPACRRLSPRRPRERGKSRYRSMLDRQSKNGVQLILTNHLSRDFFQISESGGFSGLSSSQEHDHVNVILDMSDNGIRYTYKCYGI